MMRAGHSRRAGLLLIAGPLLYRLPMSVTKIRAFPHCREAPAYPVCPRCDGTMEREYMAFCSRCGQKLDWQHYPHARILYVGMDGDARPGGPAPPR